jgi:hypothetical protein
MQLAVCLVLALSWASVSQAQNSGPFQLGSNSGGELQIGTGLPLPVGTAGIFLGGKTAGDAGNFPPLLIPPVAGVLAGGAESVGINQTTGGNLTIPPGVLARAAGGSPVPIAVFTTNPAVFQVATSIDYGWPSTTATFSAGGAPGPAVLGTGVSGGIASYSGGAQAFGGPATFSIAAGSGAAGGRVPPNTMGALPVASVWINAFAGLPGTVTMVLIAGASSPLGIAQPGNSTAAPSGTTMFGAPAQGIGFVNGPQITVTPPGPLPLSIAGPVGTMGTITNSLAVTAPVPSNMVTNSKGFAWTTGFLTLSQPGAGPPEVFYLSGTDMRVGGVGNVSLVSGALSNRQLSGPNANRGWLSLDLVAAPEPAATAGLAGALGALALCHTAVRRRARR